MNRLPKVTDDFQLGCYPGWILFRLIFSQCYYNHHTGELVWDDREFPGKGYAYEWGY